jgi:branched-chain amino acid transport system ATP-binding protein
VFALFPRLRERQAQAGGTLSGGEQQMLAIGRALLTNGRLLLLDEPSEGLALVPQGRRIFAPLSVRENLLLGARASGWTLDRVFALFPRLRERQAQAGGTLSGGEQQMLAIGRALLTNGRLLLLDEPSEGLAPRIVREIGSILVALKAERLSLLLVEQNYHLALRVADRVYVMNKGQIVYEGTPAGLEADEEIKRRYLGVA